MIIYIGRAQWKLFSKAIMFILKFKIYSLLAFLPDVSYFSSDSILRRLFITSNIFSHNYQNNSFLGLVSFFMCGKIISASLINLLPLLSFHHFSRPDPIESAFVPHPVVNTQQMEQIVSAEPANEESVRMETG